MIRLGCYRMATGLSAEPAPANLAYWCRDDPCLRCLAAALMNPARAVVCDLR